jgi:secondary thiamine-phosphate synthase enzyme
VKHARKELWFEVPQRRAYLNITPQVEEFVRESGIANGLCLVNPMHITAAVYVNDDEAGLLQDIDDWLERLAPHEPVSRYRHNVGEDNADAHLKRTIMGHQVMLPITSGALDLGPWEQVFYAEFDGQRKKRVVVKVMGVE